jgi:hypothetical protein
MLRFFFQTAHDCRKANHLFLSKQDQQTAAFFVVVSVGKPFCFVM